MTNTRPRISIIAGKAYYANTEERTPTTRGDRAPMTHRLCDHVDTKAARAKCRRAIYALRAEIQAELKGN